MLFSLLSTTLLAQTNKSGIISTNETWGLAGSPYIITNNVTINSGVTVTIESGVEVKFNDGFSMFIDGTVNATGATFTSNNATPVPGSAGYIRVGNFASALSGIGSFTSCSFAYFDFIAAEHGSLSISGSSLTNFSQYGIRAYNAASLTLDNTTISNVGTSSSYRTVEIEGSATASITGGILDGKNYDVVGIHGTSNVTLSGVTIQNSPNYPIYISGNPSVSYTSVTFTANKYNVVYFSSNISTTLTLNNPGIPYNMAGSVISGGNLTIKPGTILKFAHRFFEVHGKLTAVGDTTGKIFFTSWYDDNLGGDSNADGANTAASVSSYGWYGIRFNGDSDDTSLLDSVDVRFVNNYTNTGGVTLLNASPTIQNSTFSNCYFGATFLESSSPVFANNTISGSQQTPVAMSFEANPTLTNNIFGTSDNEYDAIGLLGGTLTANAQLKKRDFTDIPNVTYVLLNSVVIPSGFSLAIDPGVVIKAHHGQYIENHGTFNVNGTSAEKVVLTSVHDDNFGNPQDTRNDGNVSVPAAGNFGGIHFSSTTTATSAIDTALIKFARNSHSYGIQYVYTNYYYSAISIDGSAPKIRGTIITDTEYGVALRNSAATISNVEMVNTSKAPIRISVSSNPILENIIFSSVGWRGLAILPEHINYTATLGKRDVAGIPNITYILEGLKILAGSQVTLDSGLVIKARNYTLIEVEGGFKIAGTSTAHVTITSIADDNAGASPNATDNDTEGNGNATLPEHNKWGGIIYYSGSDDVFSEIAYADFNYGGHASLAPYYIGGTVIWDNAAAKIYQSTIRYAANNGLAFYGASTPIVDFVTIQSSLYNPIAISYFANPTFTNITFNANGSNGLQLIESTLSSNATLYKRDIAGITNIAYIMNNLTVNSGATLTINPGVVVKMASYGNIDIADGAFSANGTTTEAIIFTSIKDDSRGGDTNNDGNTTIPQAGDWRGIFMRASTVQTALRYCEFRYGGSAAQNDYYYNHSDRYATVISNNSNPIVENCVIQFSNTNGIGAYGTSTATFNNNRISNLNTYSTPVQVSMFANPTFSGNTIENVGLTAIKIQSETYTQTNTFVFRSFAGYDSISYILPNVSIGVGTEITIPAGMVFKTDYYSTISVEGKLNILGTATNPVIFTKIQDDQYGRPLDTQNDGVYPYEIGRSNIHIKFLNISDDLSVIDNILVRYADQGILLESASPTIQNSTFELSNWGIGNTGISEPRILNNKFNNLTNTPFYTSLVAYPIETTGNTMSGTTQKAITILNETLTQDTTLYKRSFGGITNIPYIFNQYTIGTGVKLIIKPGVILKFKYSSDYYYYQGFMRVYGALEAIGGPNSDSTIIFTSLSDDFYGGNTDNINSTDKTQWTGIVFENEASDSQCKLDNVIVKNSYYAGVLLNSASPTISNTAFISNHQWGLRLTGASNPILITNDFIDNGTAYASYGKGLSNEGSFTVDATGSWWGHNSGPYHETDNTVGKGNEVVGLVTFNPWATNSSINPITGDVSLNGYVTAYDAALVLQAVAALTTLTPTQNRAADVSDDKTTGAMDASYILQFSAGLIRSFPAEAENKRTNTADRHSEVQVLLGEQIITDATQEVKIPLTLSNVGKLYALEVQLDLDEELNLVRFEKNETNTISYTTNTQGSKFFLTFAQSTPVTQDQLLGHLVVNLKNEYVLKTELLITPSKAVGNETNVIQFANAGRVNVDQSILSIDAELQQALTIYPNPLSGSDAFTITIPKGSEGSGFVQVLNTQGQVIKQLDFNNKASLKVPVKGMKRGIYMVKINVEGRVAVSKVVIE